jgi:hypothetical protein
MMQTNCNASSVVSTIARKRSVGHRAVHVVVPEEAYHNAKLAAVASRLPFKVFMAQLMLGARAIAVDSPVTAGSPNAKTT